MTRRRKHPRLRARLRSSTYMDRVGETVKDKVSLRAHEGLMIRV